MEIKLKSDTTYHARPYLVPEGYKKPLRKEIVKG